MLLVKTDLTCGSVRVLTLEQFRKHSPFGLANLVAVSTRRQLASLRERAFQRLHDEKGKRVLPHLLSRLSAFHFKIVTHAADNAPIIVRFQQKYAQKVLANEHEMVRHNQVMEKPRESTDESLPQRLNRLLRERDWFAADLERKSGVHRNTLGRILRGETRSPDNATVEMIASALEVSPSYLRYGIDEQRPPAAPEVLQKIEALIQLSPNEADLLRVFRAASPLLQDKILKTVRQLIDKGQIVT